MSTAAPSDEAVRIRVDGGHVSGLLGGATGAWAMMTLAHGAGADMHHGFLAALASRLVARGIATLRHQFPYTEAGRRRIDAKPLLLATIDAVAAFARERAGALPLLVGGKSMGGRMATLAAAAAPLPGVAGLVLLGFPLHPRGAPTTDRAAHLGAIGVPMLVLQGTRDELGTPDELRPWLPAVARMHVVEHADHGFAVLRRSGRTADAVLDELADTITAFARRPTP